MRSLSACCAALIATVMLAAPAEKGERWTCQLDLHQGDTGSLELSRDNGHITGKTVVHRGERTFEHEIVGEWSGTRIHFRRSLDAGSYQPFQGEVTDVAPGKVTMLGQFAANWAGTWSCQCERVSPAETVPPRLTMKAPPVKVLAPLRPMPAATVTRTGAAAQPGLILDLERAAPRARWSNSWKILPFPGDPASDLGFARLVPNARLEDGQTYGEVLQTHPQWRPHGLIVGRYAEIEIPREGAELRAGIGFLAGASRSDGVSFQVWGEFSGYHGVPVRREYHKPYTGSVITDFSQDLSRFAGMKGTVALAVNAGDASSEQDWAVWVGPRLLSLEYEVAFPSFVGAAVGSRREGNRLLGAGGEVAPGDVVLYLLFAHVDRDMPVGIQSFREGQPRGGTTLPPLRAGQTEIWRTLHRTEEGRWRERVILDGTYVGEISYTISRM